MGMTWEALRSWIIMILTIIHLALRKYTNGIQWVHERISAINLQMSEFANGQQRRRFRKSMKRLKLKFNLLILFIIVHLFLKWVPMKSICSGCSGLSSREVNSPHGLTYRHLRPEKSPALASLGWQICSPPGFAMENGHRNSWPMKNIWTVWFSTVM